MLPPALQKRLSKEPDPELLRRLAQGADEWNSWREANPDIVPDFDNAVLRDVTLDRMDLSGARFMHADLTGAVIRWGSLAGADFQWARLDRARFSNVSLNGVRFETASLVDAYLAHAKLDGAHLRGVDLSEADLRAVKLTGANLEHARFDGALMTQADLSGADLRHTSFAMTRMSMAKLVGANLSAADLSGADLSGSDLSHAILVGARFNDANLSRSRIYGVAAWDVELDGADQTSLSIAAPGESTLMVDHLEIAQFIHLMMRSSKIRTVIDTLTAKVVLILGRFSEDRKGVLDGIRDALRRRDYVPILFDFEKPASRDLTETISTLAHLARFIIADITDAKSLPQELERIVPDLPSVPVQPLLLLGEHEYAMFEHFRRYPWVLPVHTYVDQASLLATLATAVIEPAEAKVIELAPRR